MSAKKTTILAVDDDHLLLKLITHSLEFEGYTVLTASDGREALELISTQVPDLEPDPTHPRYLLTKPGIGYMLVAPADLQGGR